MQLRLPRGEDSVGSFAEMLSESLTDCELELIKHPSLVPSRRSADEVLLDNLLQLWTLKESFVKALGTGLSTDLRSVSFGSLPLLNQPVLLSFDGPQCISMNLQSGLQPTLDEEPPKDWAFWVTVLSFSRSALDSLDTNSNEVVMHHYVLSVAARLRHEDLTDDVSHVVNFKSVSQLMTALSAQT